MPRCGEPSPPVTGRRCRFWLRFGLLIVISFIWTHGSTRGLPGVPGGGGSGRLCCCPDCGEPGNKVRNSPLYRCKKGHDFTSAQAVLGRKMKEEREKEEKKKEKDRK